MIAKLEYKAWEKISGNDLYRNSKDIYVRFCGLCSDIFKG